MSTPALDRGRASYNAHAWGDAYALLSAADRESPLEPEDLERLAATAHLVGKEAASTDLLARAHQGFIGLGQPERAARCAFWLAFGLLYSGEKAKASGWLARARRLLDDGQRDCVEQGYLLMPIGMQSFHQGDNTAAHDSFVEAAAIGRRFGDADLANMALQGQGRTLLRRGEIARGVALLDEAMVAVTTGEISPPVAGTIYCSVIEACHEVFDLRRAQEWTAALTQWCAAQPDVVLYRGHCQVRRAEILQLHGAWPDALKEAERARDPLSDPATQPWLGASAYRMAELHRLRGDFVEAEAGYRQAREWGRAPEPGQALLRLAQGQLAQATAAIRRVTDETREDRNRSIVLAAAVEILLAANDVSAARTAADELAEIAGRLGAPLLGALSATATGAVLLAEREAKAALAELRAGLTAWRELDAPYEAARVGVLLGLSCQELGDRDTMNLELDAARRVFERLGARPDFARVERLLSREQLKPAGGLTAREVEVLTLVASGKTNRGIATALHISEKTVARHVSNIFTKLGLSSRAAATAYAYQQHLVKGPSA